MLKNGPESSNNLFGTCCSVNRESTFFPILPSKLSKA